MSLAGVTVPSDLDSDFPIPSSVPAVIPVPSNGPAPVASDSDVQVMTRRLTAEFAAVPTREVVAAVRECLYENPSGSAEVIEAATRLRVTIRRRNAKQGSR
jgi:hypothetical protein